MIDSDMIDDSHSSSGPITRTQFKVLPFTRIRAGLPRRPVPRPARATPGQSDPLTARRHNYMESGYHNLPLAVLEAQAVPASASLSTVAAAEVRNRHGGPGTAASRGLSGRRRAARVTPPLRPPSLAAGSRQ